jgi:type IV pilus assembly protein PilB
MSAPYSTDIPVRDLKKEKVSFDVLKYVPEESASHYRFVPLGIENSVLEIGVVDPDNMEALDAISFITMRLGMPFKLFRITEEDFNEVLLGYKGLGGQVTKALEEFDTVADGSDKNDEIEITSMGGEVSNTNGGKIVEEAPVTKIVGVIIQHATEGNASDVHIEPLADRVRVRFRVDGVMYTSLFLPTSVHDAVVARIKILTNMKLDEKRKPQDGRFSANIKGRVVDFRVSTFPTSTGEKVVIRILDSEKGLKKIDTVGFDEDQLAIVRRAIQRPYGLILITGPTGSGKSTTLYSMLNELDHEKFNIVTLEDPVEFSMAGVNQSSVRPEIDYTFANGLRSILRQDPDIIMVGEIRDKETAQLAIHAALTGHLVLSTLHTNNVLGVVPRLIDMGVEPYFIAPTLVLAIAQRLVRVMCPDAKSPVPVDGAIKTYIDKQFEDLPASARNKISIPKDVYHAVSTPTCSSGTKGRMAVFEMLEMNKELEQFILKNPAESDIYNFARAQGMLTMKDDALVKAFKGLIPFEEIDNL